MCSRVSWDWVLLGKSSTKLEQKGVSDEAGIPLWVNEFIREMDKAFAAADVIVSRAGAMAISEICVIAKPAVFVPYPHAAEDHQTSNARNLQDKRAGIMIRDSEAGEKLVDELIALLNDWARREELSRNIAPLGIRNADEVIADTIIRQLGQ